MVLKYDLQRGDVFEYWGKTHVVIERGDGMRIISTTKADRNKITNWLIENHYSLDSQSDGQGNVADPPPDAERPELAPPNPASSKPATPNPAFSLPQLPINKETDVFVQYGLTKRLIVMDGACFFHALAFFQEYEEGGGVYDRPYKNDDRAGNIREQFVEIARTYFDTNWNDEWESKDQKDIFVSACIGNDGEQDNFDAALTKGKIFFITEYLRALSRSNRWADTFLIQTLLPIWHHDNSNVLRTSNIMLLNKDGFDPRLLSGAASNVEAPRLKCLVHTNENHYDTAMPIQELLPEFKSYAEALSTRYFGQQQLQPVDKDGDFSSGLHVCIDFQHANDSVTMQTAVSDMHAKLQKLYGYEPEEIVSGALTLLYVNHKDTIAVKEAFLTVSETNATLKQERIAQLSMVLGRIFRLLADFVLKTLYTKFLTSIRLPFKQHSITRENGEAESIYDYAAQPNNTNKDALENEFKQRCRANQHTFTFHIPLPLVQHNTIQNYVEQLGSYWIPSVNYAWMGNYWYDYKSAFDLAHVEFKLYGADGSSSPAS